MGRKLVLTGTTLTDPDAPTLATIDQMESAGSLLLIEPNHPYQAWDAGVPTSGAIVPNLLRGALVPTSNPTITIEGSIANGTKGAIERSTKGGLHVIVSQANALAENDGVRINPGTAISAYIEANLDHDYYFSVWDRLTRASAGGVSAISYGTHEASTSLGVFHSGLTSWTTPGVQSGARVLGNVPGPRFGNVAVDSAVSPVRACLPAWGAPNLSLNKFVLASRNNTWPSFVLYRVYLEDLTVSGRSYAEVDELDHALYTRQVLTAGGRYYGDTYTDPATIP